MKKLYNLALCATLVLTASQLFSSHDFAQKFITDINESISENKKLYKKAYEQMQRASEKPMGKELLKQFLGEHALGIIETIGHLNPSNVKLVDSNTLGMSSETFRFLTLAMDPSLYDMPIMKQTFPLKKKDSAELVMSKLLKKGHFAKKKKQYLVPFTHQDYIDLRISSINTRVAIFSFISSKYMQQISHLKGQLGGKYLDTLKTISSFKTTKLKQHDEYNISIEPSTYQFLVALFSLNYEDFPQATKDTMPQHKYEKSRNRILTLLQHATLDQNSAAYIAPIDYL